MSRFAQNRRWFLIAMAGAALVIAVSVFVVAILIVDRGDTGRKHNRQVFGHQVARKADKAAVMKVSKAAKAEAVKTRTIVRKQTRTIVKQLTRTIVKRELGRRGVAGRPPTAEEIDAAVSRALPGIFAALKSCLASGGCGAPSAPALTSAQLADALRPLVEGYCQAQGCGTPGPRGEKGDKGDKGEDGTNGMNGMDGLPGPPPQPFTFTLSFIDGQGVEQTRVCTIDPNVGPSVVQPCGPVAGG